MTVDLDLSWKRSDQNRPRAAICRVTDALGLSVVVRNSDFLPQPAAAGQKRASIV